MLRSDIVNVDGKLLLFLNDAPPNAVRLTVISLTEGSLFGPKNSTVILATLPSPSASVALGKPDSVNVTELSFPVYLMLCMCPFEKLISCDVCTSERVKYFSVKDNQAIEALKLCSRLEGIIPALEPSHALYFVTKFAPKQKKNHIIVMNLCGRGDKDLDAIAPLLNI